MSGNLSLFTLCGKANGTVEFVRLVFAAWAGFDSAGAGVDEDAAFAQAARAGLLRNAHVGESGRKTSITREQSRFPSGISSA